jgi:hypothetical protein
MPSFSTVAGQGGSHREIRRRCQVAPDMVPWRYVRFRGTGVVVRTIEG